MLLGNLPSGKGAGHFPYKNNFPQSESMYGPQKPQAVGTYAGPMWQDKLGPNANNVPLPCFGKDALPGRKKKKKDTPPGQAGPPAQPTPPAEQKRHEVDVNGLPRVEVCGLPRHLMSKPMMLATLEAAGLDKDVLGFTFHGPPMYPDMALFTVVSEHAAVRCAQHFHGCKWRESQGGKPVEAVVHPGLTSQQGTPRQHQHTAPMPLPPGLTQQQGTPKQSPQTAPMPLPPGLCTKKGPGTSYTNNMIPTKWQAANQAGYHSPYPPAEAPAYVRFGSKEQAPRRKGTCTSDESTNVSDEDRCGWQSCSV